MKIRINTDTKCQRRHGQRRDATATAVKMQESQNTRQKQTTEWPQPCTRVRRRVQGSGEAPNTG